jgi:nitrate reductase gamma subunit
MNSASPVRYMGLVLFLVAYIAYAAFWCRIFSHVFIWYRAAKLYKAVSVPKPVGSARVCALSAIDLVFFRRLFESSKMLWLGSWTFHVSFVFVILRHLRYFLDPVPACITFLQPVGRLAGYVLPFSLFYLILLRLAGRQRYVSRYVSYYNFFLLGLLFSISSIGLLMHMFFVPDLMAVKEFALGILSFRLQPFPGSTLFIIHFALVLLLLPYLPTHFFSAPLVVAEANKREEGLNELLHG